MSVNKVNQDGSLTRIAGIMPVDQTYNPLSERPQSGIAVAAAVAGSGGGGLLPHLIIISEDGESEVKAVKGSIEIIATRTSAGHYECDVPEFGTWTIHAVLNGDDATVNLVVDTVKVYTVDDSHFHADITVNFPVWEATCNLAGQGESYYATSDPYTFTVHSAGTYTITVVEGSNTYTDTVEVTATGQTFSKVVPYPADAPTGDINYWLWYGGINNTQGDYSSLADILADTTALSALMASQNAVDYLVINTSWASSITANEDAMTYIGLNNYASNTLLADSTWCNAICNSTYFESVLNVKVPIMTSNTTPEGECFASSVYQNEQPYRSFDGNQSTSGMVNSQSGFVGYIFTDAVFIYKAVSNRQHIDGAVTSLEASTDGTNWIKLCDFTDTQTNVSETHTFMPSAKYDRYRFNIRNTNPNYGFARFFDGQLYGRKDV